MKRVAIIYHYFAHYRLPILLELVKSKEVNYFFISDPVSGNDIQVINFENNELFKDRYFKVKNIQIKMFLWQKGLLGILRRENFDSVIFLGEDRFISTWISLCLMRLFNKKAYLWSHGLYGREPAIKKKLRVAFNKLAAGTFVYNNRAKELLIKEGVNKDKLTVIYNSLNYEDTESHRKLYNAQVKDQIASVFQNTALPIAFCISRINASKKIDLLIEAINILKKQGFLMNCFIIGDGKDELTKLKNLVTRLELAGQVYFTGGLYNEKQISEYILSSDICVCPASLGLTAIHSLSYGVPVITHNNFPFHGPEFEAIEPKVTGDFYEYGDVNDLADKIKNCISIRNTDKELNINNCLAVIKNYYNPKVQLAIFNKVLK